jgi:uncharacterized protein (DUF2236 family)
VDERSVSFRRYAADGTVVLGGAAALLLQLGDPVVARGVAAHSAFARDPMGRLRNTLTYVYAIALGTPEQRRRVAALVDRAHTGVTGATDPDRQLWVAATLVGVGIRAAELLRGPLDPALADEIVAAGAELATALQLPVAAWPTDRAAFERYWEEAVARLEVGDDARAVARDILHPRVVPWWARLAMPLVRGVTADLLPPRIRVAYDLPSSRAAVPVLRVLVRVAPRALRELPSRRLLGRLSRTR